MDPAPPHSTAPEPPPASGWPGRALGVVRAIDAVGRTVWKLVLWLTLAMVLVGTYNALSRYLETYTEARLASNAWIELAWYLFSLVFLLAAPWALRIGAHVRVDVLYGRVSARTKRWIDLGGTLLFTIPFSAFALFIALPAVQRSIAIGETSPDPGGLARWPIKLVIPIAFGLLLAAAIAEALRHAVWLFGSDADRARVEAADREAGVKD